MASSVQIPVVDFSACAVGSEEQVNPTKPGIRALADQIIGALETPGFVYLTNHGIPASQVEDANSKSRSFFSQSEEVKQKYAREHEVNAWHGWVGINNERLNPKRPADYKETFNITSLTKELWPDEVVPGFREATTTLHRSCTKLCDRVLHLIGIGLKLQNPRMLSDTHRYGSAGDTTSVRLSHYPGVKSGTSLEPDQLPMGEHAAYGSVGLFQQDNISGVQMRTRAGDFVPLTRTDNAILLVNGYAMGYWTSDRLEATDMRAVLPDSEAGRSSSRYSIIFYACPHFEKMLESVDGNSKYPPITYEDFTAAKSKAIYADN